METPLQKNYKTSTENSFDYQHHLPHFKDILAIQEFFAAKEKAPSRYSFPHRADILANTVKRKIFDAVVKDEAANIFAFPSQTITDIKWRGVIDYLQKNSGIRNLTLDQPFNDEIGLYFFDLFSPLNLSLTDGHSPQYAGYSRGVSENYDEAISKVIGEYLERYPLLIYRKKDLIRASIQSLERAEKKFLDPRHISEFSDEQKKERAELNFDEQTIFHWVKGKSLLDNSDTLIPAQLVFWTYCRHNDDSREPMLRESNTNGAGGNFTREGAILSGLYECVQRDAFFIHWFNQKSPRQIDNPTIVNPRIRRLLQKAERLRFEVYLLDTTFDTGIPAAVAVIVDNSGIGPKIALGGGCGFNAAETLLRALTEACSLYHWIRKKSVSFDMPKIYKPFSSGAIGQLERLRIWGNSNMFSKLNFLFNGEKIPYQDFAKRERNFKSESEELRCAVFEVSKLGKEYVPFYYEPNHPLLRELGYHSAKVIIPKLISLYLHENNAPAAAPRIKEAMRNMGLAPALHINPCRILSHKVYNFFAVFRVNDIIFI